MIGSSVIGAVSAIAASDTANGSFSVFLPLILNAIGAMAEVPQGAVMSFNLASCPSGWTEVTSARGRAIVGLPSDGTLEGTLGTALGDLENRGHSHVVDPPSTSTTSAGGHNHGIDPPATTSTSAGLHSHYVNPSNTSTTYNNHNHRWSYFRAGTNMWNSYNSLGGTVNIYDHSDGGDLGGSFFYPIGVGPQGADVYFYTGNDGHNHVVDIPTFVSSDSGLHTHSTNTPSFTSGSIGNHTHSVNIPTTPSTTASTSDVMPYIQFLVCEKD
jgi:hypothetical protein